MREKRGAGVSFITWVMRRRPRREDSWTYGSPGFTSTAAKHEVQKKKKMDQAMDNEWSSWDAAASP